MATERPELFAEFVALRSPALQRTAYLLVGDEGRARELVHDALVRTYLGWSRLHEPSQAEDFARTAIVRGAIARPRRGARPPEPPAPVPHVPGVGLHADADDPDDLADPGERVWAGLMLLPARQRAAIVLRYHDELTDREVAETLRCGVRTAERELAAGLAELHRRAGDGALSREAHR